jgi:hypothetical protein
MGRVLDVSDPFVNIWGLWWVEQSIIHLHNPWWTAQILAPNGTYLAYHALVPLAGVVLAPLTALLGPGLTFNLTELLLPPAAAVTARLLGRELGLGRTAAWVAGGIYGFSIIVDWRTQFHMNFGFPMPFIPIAVLFAVRYTRTRARRDAVLSGGVAGLVMLLDPIMALLTALGVALWVLVAALESRAWRDWTRFGALAILAGGIVGSPQLAMMADAAANGGYQANNVALAGSWISGETNVLTMLSPGNVRSIVPGNLQSLAYQHPWGEATPAYGWGALGLAACLLILAFVFRRHRRIPGLMVAWGLVVVLLCSWLALGPQFRFASAAHIPLAYHRYGQLVSPLMPFTWLTYIPLFGDVHEPSRFTMLGMLGLAMLAGAGFAQLRAEGRVGVVIATLLVGFAVLESGFPDGGASKAWVPMSRSALYAPIRADRTKSIVVDVPLGFFGSTAGAGTSPGEIEPMFRATQHGHPIAEGYVTRLTQSSVDRLVAHPLYGGILAEEAGAQNHVTPKVAAADARVLDARWVVLWPQANQAVRSYVARMGFRPVASQDGIEVLRLG